MQRANRSLRNAAGKGVDANPIVRFEAQSTRIASAPSRLVPDMMPMYKSLTSGGYSKRPKLLLRSCARYSEPNAATDSNAGLSRAGKGSAFGSATRMGF